MKDFVSTSTGGGGPRAACLAACLACVPAAAAAGDAEARFRGTGKADPVRIDNTRVTAGPAAGQAGVAFDAAWDHSWRAAWKATAEEMGGTAAVDLENWDAAWVFVKFRKPGAGFWSHATLSPTAADHAAPTGATLAVGPSQDGTSGVGAFLHRAAAGAGPVDWKGVRLRWLAQADGVDDPTKVEVRVFAVKMVYVPQGAFWAGDGSTADVAGQFSAGDTTAPFRVESEEAITVGGVDPKNLGNREGFGMFRSEDCTSRGSHLLKKEFPKGFAPFYCMRHEITQGDYVAFLNSLSYGQLVHLLGPEWNDPGRPDAPAGTLLVNEASRGCRIKIKEPGVPEADGKPAKPPVLETENPHVACINLLFTDYVAYAGWAGLRPITELEYEKACRGPLAPVADEYAWRTTGLAGTNRPEPRSGYVLENAGQADERVTWQGDEGPDATRGNAVWWGTVSQERGSYALHPINGPLRVEIFATPTSGRVESGASYWGIMELTGNAAEMTVTVGSDVGRRFAGTHGDGTLAQAQPDKRILDQPAGWDLTDFKGFRRRGGSYAWWADHRGTLRVSDRWGSVMPETVREKAFSYGFRCVRTAPAK